jgi:hypothetical protein
MAAGDHHVAASASTFGPYVLSGLVLEQESDLPAGLAHVAHLVRELAGRPDPAAWGRILNEIACTVFRASVRLGEPVHVEAPPAVSRPIDVGRVRWCSLTDRPIIWIPLFTDNPEMVGAPDQVWTLDSPGPEAVWHSQPPSVQLDPDWHSRIVLFPEDLRLWCIDPDGRSWVLPSTFLDLLERRTQHLGAWLRALEDLDHPPPGAPEDRPAIAASTSPDQLPPDEAASTAAAAILPPATAPGDRYSRDWILERVARYSYESDEPAQAAGRAASSAGYYSRAGFLDVVRWKSPRSVGLAERNSSVKIESTSRRAIGTSDERERMNALLELEGVGVPVASALLHFAVPELYPILDFRALESLGDNRRRTHYTVDFWIDYLDRCQALADRAGVSIRQLDKALWQDSRERTENKRWPR